MKSHLIIFQNPPDWTEILNYFRGSELQNYFRRIIEDQLVMSIKPQYIDVVIKAVGDRQVSDVLKHKDSKGIMNTIIVDLGKIYKIYECDYCYFLDLEHLLSRKCSELSGGEL